MCLLRFRAHLIVLAISCFVQVGADDRDTLDKIIDSLNSIAKTSANNELDKGKNMISLKVGKLQENGVEKNNDEKKKKLVLILGAGRVCRPAAELLASIGALSSQHTLKSCIEPEFEEQNCVEVIVASLYLKDAAEVYTSY